MKLSAYLEATGETQQAFAERAGLPLSTVNRLVGGAFRCRIDIAHKVVVASQACPSSSGGFVTFEELIPAEGNAA